MATLRVRASQKNRRHSRYFTQRKLNTRNWRQKSWKAKQQTVRQSGLGHRWQELLPVLGWGDRWGRWRYRLGVAESWQEPPQGWNRGGTGWFYRS